MSILTVFSETGYAMKLVLQVVSIVFMVYALNCNPAEAGEGGSGIRVKKSLHLENAQIYAMSYVSKDKPVLLEAAQFVKGMPHDGSRDILIRISRDNGKSWENYSAWPTSIKEGNKTVKRSCPQWYLDPDNGILVEFSSRYEVSSSRPMSFGPDAEEDPLELRSHRVFYRISRDEGKTWSEDKQLIQNGYDKDQWCASVKYGSNSAYVYPNMGKKLKDGTLLIPTGIFYMGEDGKFVKLPDRFGDVLWPDESCACLLGRWNDDLSDIEWEMTSEIKVPEYMSFGLSEPSVVETDGKLMMLMRGCAAARQSFPGVKFFSTSKDSGKTWGPAVPLTYPDGSFVNSPASFGWAFNSRKNGKLYYIANIIDRPVRQSDPRNPLSIVEVDRAYLWVKPETLTTIAKRRPENPKFIRFSNWVQVEDRETGDIRLYMTEARIDSIFNDPGEVSPHSYRYEIQLPVSGNSAD